MVLSAGFCAHSQSEKKKCKNGCKSTFQISSDDWLFSCPDLNPLDYKLWSVLQERACAPGHQNLDSPKAAIVKAVREIPPPPHAMIHESINDRPNICGAVCQQNDVRVVAMSFLKYFLSFLKIL